MIDFRKKKLSMEYILKIILLVYLIMVFALSHEVKALKCYVCNEQYEVDPKCDEITKNQENYLVECDSSVDRCMRVVHYGASDEANTSENSSNGEAELAADDGTVTSRRCAPADIVSWCRELSYPSIDCAICNTTGCNGFDMNP